MNNNNNNNNKVANTMKKLSKYVLLVFLCIFTINAQDKSVKLITDYKILFSYNIVDESTFC